MSQTAGPGPTKDDCTHALEQMYSFLDHELDTASSDAIREHLAACEPCLEAFDVEQAVKMLVHRRCGGDVAPSHLRAKVIASITTTTRVEFRQG
jgi:mycothiol system anti-sigma-R factor